MGVMTPEYDPVAKITILPRSNGAGGFTLFVPNEDRMDGGMYSLRRLPRGLRAAVDLCRDRPQILANFC